ncbi:MAG: SDR family NAD(P)-dependent oxidoreductase [Candidatus Omnitrophota bacterium]
MSENEKKAIVIGASSGIGAALAVLLAEDGYEVGVTARRIELLRGLQQRIPSRVVIKQMDVARSGEAMLLLEELIAELGGLDLIVINAGVNPGNARLEWEPEWETISVNVCGFAAMANVAMRHFLRQNTGHLVGISSIAGLKGSAKRPSYSASKAFVFNYLQGLRFRARGTGIYITDIRPGFVDTMMIKKTKTTFWVASPQTAAKQILQAVKKKEKTAYITQRWVLISWLIRILPDWLCGLQYKKELDQDA